MCVVYRFRSGFPTRNSFSRLLVLRLKTVMASLAFQIIDIQVDHQV